MKNVLVASFDTQDTHPETSGCFSESSWRGTDMRAALGQLFRLRKDEMISSIIVTENGLKVKIVNKADVAK